MNWGVGERAARSLAVTFSPQHVRLWVAYLEHRLAQGWLPKESPAAWLVAAIRSDDWQVPAWFVQQQRATREQVRLAGEERVRIESGRKAEEREAAKTRRAIERALGIGSKTRVLWDEVKKELERRGELHPSLVTAYLLPLHGPRARLVTPVPFLAEFIERHAEKVRSALQLVAEEEVAEVVVEVREDLLDE